MVIRCVPVGDPQLCRAAALLRAYRPPDHVVPGRQVAANAGPALTLP